VIRLVVFALVLAAVALPGRTEAEAPVGSEFFVDDDAIVQRMEVEGTALIKAGKHTKVKTLRAQLLQAKACSLDLPAADNATLTPTELFARRAGGVVVLGVLAKVKKRARYEMAGCSGFALTEDVLVTNYHVIDSPEGEALVVATRDGQMFSVTEVLAADKLTDVAIVRAAGAKFVPIPLAADVPAPGAPIWVISHPDHNFFSCTSGIVSRHFIATTDHGKTPQMAVTADFGAGSSGGPILDAQGSVTGIVCSTTSVYYQDEKAKINDLQMVFKHCIPVASIRKLIEPKAP
jgi:S1-C subfamily serine protease